MKKWRELPLTHVMPHHQMVDGRSVAMFHEARKKVVTWTVNDEREMRRVAEAGVDAVISDDPQLLCSTLGGI